MLKDYKIRCFKLIWNILSHISRKICFPIFAIKAGIKTEETQLFGPSCSERVVKGEN